MVVVRLVLVVCVNHMCTCGCYDDDEVVMMMMMRW